MSDVSLPSVSLAGVSLIGAALLGGALLSLTSLGCSAPPAPSKPQPMGVLPTAVTSATPLWVPFRVRAGKPLSPPSPSQLTELRQLTFDGHAGAAVFEPGGEAIVYETGAGEGRCGKLMRLHLQTGERTAVEPVDGALAAPYLAAQAQLLAVSSRKDEARCSPWGHTHGRQLSLAPSGITALPYPKAGASAGRYQISGKGYNGSPALSPDGRGLVFTSTRDGVPDLYAMTLGEQSVARLTQTPGYDGWARWSPDGRQLVWHAEPIVFGVTAAAGQAKAGDEAAASGKSGTRKDARAGTKTQTSQRKRGQAKPDKKAAAQVTSGPAAPADPTIRTPAKLVVMLGGPGAQSARVIADFGRYSAMPTFAPDSRHVLFASDRDHRGEGPRNYEIYRFDPDGPVTATGHPQLSRITFHAGYDGAPAVSPDGHHLLFTSSRNSKPGETNIFIARLDGR